MLRRLCEETKTNSDLNHFLKIASQSFWTKSAEDIKDSIADIQSKSAQKILYNKSGLECLELYHSLFVEKNKNTFTAGARIYIKQFLENKGADYYCWLYFGKGCSRLRGSFGQYNWSCYLGHGSFAHAHLLEKKKIYKKTYSTRLVTMLDQIKNLNDIGITSPSKIKEASLLQHREDHENDNFTVIKLQKLEHSIENILRHQNDALKEIKILQDTQHENILRMKSHGIIDTRVYIELEYADLGTLSHKLNKMTDYWELSNIVECWKQILHGISFIHSIRIIHRDIKCDNIFIFHYENRIVYKLGDFNLSRSLSTTSSHATSVCGSRSTMAPEIFANEPYSYSVDIWSFLCVALQTLGIKKMNPISISTEVLLQRIPEFYTNDKLFDFISSLHNIQPNIRPTALQCLESIEMLYLNSTKSKHQF